MPNISPTFLKKASTEILRKIGASEDESVIVAEHLVNSDMCGVHSHGVMRLPQYAQAVKDGLLKPRAEIRILRETSSTALIDADRGFGQAVCKKAMEVAISKAYATGVGSVGVANSFHIGRLAEYAMQALKHNMIGIVVCNAVPWVAPWGGRKKLLGTNPLSFALPAGKEKPIVVDFATTTSSEGKVRVKMARGEKIPEGWIVDKEGKQTTDPSALYDNGALLPIGGYKGYALALVFEILGGALTETGCDGDVARGINGVFLQAINIEAFTPLQLYRATVDKLIRFIKESPKATGFNEILIPGEPELRQEEESLKKGIYIDEKTWSEIESLAEKLGLKLQTL